MGSLEKNRWTRRIGRIAVASAVAVAITGLGSGTAFAANVPADEVVVLKQGNQVLEDQGGGVVKLGFQNNDSSERWLMDYRTVPSPSGEYKVVLKNMQTQRCLFVVNNQQVGSKVTSGECNLTNQAHNQWRKSAPRANGSNVYTTYVGGQSLALTSTNNQLTVQKQNGSASQEFHMVRV